MKTETKFLIVAIIMILSVGPMSYFFSTQPAQITPPEKNETTSYTFSGNVTGTIIDVEPYIYFAGVSGYNNRVFAESILRSIPEIGNYSIDVSLNPNGDGYKYSIIVPVNDSVQMKKIGFRLAWRFSQFFENVANAVPYMHGKMMLPQNFTIEAASGAVNASTNNNQTLNVFMIYPRQNGASLQVFCQSLVTSLSYYLTKASNICFDTGMLEQQNYLGLSLLDVIFISPQEKVMNLNAKKIAGLEFRGRYSFAGRDSVSTTDLETQTNSSIYLLPEGNETYKGNFTIKSDYNGMDDIARIKAIFAKNNFTIEKEYKDVLVEMPENITLDGQTYDNFNLVSAFGQIGINDNIGYYNFNANVTVIYDEITNVIISKVNLS